MDQEPEREEEQDGLSASTRAAYLKLWTSFEAWCWQHGHASLPASGETLAAYLEFCVEQGWKVSSMGTAISAISRVHKAAGHHPPNHTWLGSVVWGGIRNKNRAHPHQVDAILVHELRAMVDALPGSVMGERDRALLVVGFTGAFRRGELVALNMEDVTFTPFGMFVAVRRSKTDQAGRGARVAIPCSTSPSHCPVRLLIAWLQTARISEGALFRAVDRHDNVGERLGGGDVARAIKRAARAAGLDPAKYSGTSLRAGLATSATIANKSLSSIMSHGRWVTVTGADTYVRKELLPEVDPFDVSRGLGL